MFRRPQRIVIAVCAALCTLFVLALGWLEVSKVARRKVQDQVTRAQKRLGVPIEVGRLTIGVLGAHFDDVRIGADAAIVVSRVTASVAMNPFAAGFGELDEVTVYRVRMKSPLSTVKGSVEALGERADLDAPGLAAEKSLEKLFLALPTRRLTLKSGGFTLVTDAGEPLFIAKGLEVEIDRAKRRALFKMDSLKGPGGVAERFVQGRFELSPKGRDYRFFVRRKPKDGAKANSWAISGEVAKDLSEVRGRFDVARLPSPLLTPLKGLLGDEPKARVKGTLTARRQAEMWRVEARAASLDTRIVMPLLSSAPVGPVRFALAASGSLNPADKLFALDAATVAVPSRTKGPKQEPLKFDVTGSLRIKPKAPSDQSAQARGFAVQGRLTLARADCQRVLDSAPAGLLPTIQDFKLQGTLEGSLDFRYDSTRPDDSFVELDNPRFDCRVTGEPYAYSAEHLGGPFTLQREMDKGQDAVQVSLEPDAKTFTPLAQIAASVSSTFVGSEDASFYTHHGIDTFALEGAARTNFKEGRVKVGGSTITMQTVKNLFLTHERTLSRKLQEVFLAWHLEQILSKERILEIYLNIVELGPGIFGITQASEHFFGKTPFDLTLLESAYLANLLPSPKKRYQYFCAGEMTPQFTTLVQGLLKRMLNLGRISPDRYSEAMGQSLRFYEPARAAAPACPKGASLPLEEDAP